MRHRHKGKTLDRKAQPRNLMLRNLASSLILYEKVTTTTARAKAVKSMVERLISLGRKGDLAARRELLRILPVKNAAAKVVEDLGPRYKNRTGGYSRIIKLSRRLGDNAKTVRLELID
ncbi:50S ribosomal protein L17 [Candidatus Uhrbacteria bacterium RIFCSPLOWO2_02_FULL_48_12]|uniref:Large ribosomal subunit protein bL17 n=1 Tax=Candidatus Uhrbacteria bacterium RIFCSPLOWO2_02_FULL_48_12 TaxID=1802407 RepID=A0A1F7VB33_9BACT|nr:MAG: 50S ribosomal protein L17 [Candidatus Uhrbacteria bacterium RIFCSPLOWO2_02_FULL_48_12]